MRIINVKRAIIILLVIGMMAVVAGCVRYPGEPGPEPGEENYQLEITVEVAGQITSYEGIYYIVMDADGKLETWPGEDIGDWEEDFYYVKLDEWGFYFAQNKYDSPQLSLVSSSTEDKNFRVTIDLNDLEVPSNSDFNININVLTTDLYKHTYDSLDGGYFYINTYLGSKPPISDSPGDSQDGPNFDIIKVTAVITRLY